MDALTLSSKATNCAACGAASCRPCLEKYLLSETTNDPTCPSCAKPWSHTFLAESLSGTFRKGTYKHHRENILYDREKARLPDSQEDAVRYRNAKAACAAEGPRVAELQVAIASDPENIKYITLKKECDDLYYKGSWMITDPFYTTYLQKCVERNIADSKKSTATRVYRSKLSTIYARLRPHRALVESYGLPRGGAAPEPTAVAPL